ncbi:hypothetical protein [Odoribacter lunatus]|uniref:hypothetical protein n=1 Tax=Odoribacter lunatus TaxID=2941335 RepID=UPI00203C87BE|nr:hypothetical protein [Odoribacter lunatus]
MILEIDDECLEYVKLYCFKYLNSFEIDEETGEAIQYPSDIPEVYLKHYNHSEMEEEEFRDKYKNLIIPEGKTFKQYKQSLSLKGSFTYAAYQKNKEMQELLRDKKINLDSEKFWHLLRFIYDYTWGECMNGIKVTPSCMEQLTSFSEAVRSDSETKQRLVLYANKKQYVIDNQLAIELLAQLWDNYKANYNCRELHACPVTEETQTTSNGIWAFVSAKMFIDFFKILPMGKRQGAKVSEKQKELIAHFWYFTGIVSNENILYSNDYFKAIWKRYKDYEPDSVSLYY